MHNITDEHNYHLTVQCKQDSMIVITLTTNDQSQCSFIYTETGQSKLKAAEKSQSLVIGWTAGLEHRNRILYCVENYVLNLQIQKVHEHMY